MDSSAYVSLATGRIWAKTATETDAYHPLLCHMLDVGNVALALLEHPNASHIVTLLSRALGVERIHVPRLTAFFMALHDLGKASPSFQGKAPRLWTAARQAGLPANPLPVPAFEHGLESWLALEQILPARAVLRLAMPERQENRFWNKVALALGSHHGTIYSTSYSSQYPEVRTSGALCEAWHEPWQRVRQKLVTVMETVFLDSGEPPPSCPGNLSVLCLLLNGLTILCDWIGSDECFFPPYAGDLDVYPALARDRAKHALRERQLLSFLPRAEQSPSFRSLFSDLTARTLQSALDPDELPDLPSRSLIVVEAPTGEGKTEAALLAASRLVAGGDCRGFYFALPTVATSNQMFERVRRFIARQAGDEAAPISLMLVNGQASMSTEFASLLARGQRWERDSAERIVADSWFLPRKRSLLSPYGVGTVDQALIAALNVRHVGLRLLGLSGKVLIIDEVHAYDVYMSSILERLLAWLGELGSSVVLLSATLPSGQRQRLLRSFAGDAVSVSACASGAYPLITIVDRGDPERRVRTVEPARSNRGRLIHLRRRADGERKRNDNARFLLEQTSSGGCACWIVNTVGEAQSCHSELRQMAAALPEEDRPEMILFHARFPLGRRRRIEEAVLRCFGPTGERPRRAILVATQVVEQSLDLDFDIMMSQLAPVDLLLQRAGRLHRHDFRRRLEHLKEPHFVILEPGERGSGQPEFGPNGRVYEPFILLKTLLALHDRQTVVIPDDVRGLVEAVYDSTVDLEACRKARLDANYLSQTFRDWLAEQRRMEQEADHRLLGQPDVRGRFNWQRGLEFDEDAAERDGWVAAQTRLADPSVRVVLLDAEHPDLRGGGILETANELDAAASKGLLLRSVSLSHASLVRYVTQAHDDPRVRPLDRYRALRGHYLLILTDKTFRWRQDHRDYRLRLDDELGVVITAERE